MIQPIKHFPVNWVDGMKISQKHFIAQENYFLDTLRDASSCIINQFNYGLLPVTESTLVNNTFDIYNSATNDVQLVIKQCQALTPAGFRIAISNLSINVNSLPSFNKQMLANETEKQYYIIVSVNPFDHIPAGEFDPEETPPRHISTQPKYNVEIVAANTVNNESAGGNYIVVGRVSFTNGLVSADATFLPPCTNLHSHPVLLNYYNDFAKKMASIQQFAVSIIQKNSFKNQNSVLAESVKNISSVLLTQFANSYFYYRNTVHQLSPIYFVNVFAQLAHTLYNALDILPAKEKEEMLNYCYEWSEIAPHVLLNQLSGIIEINYDHHKNGEYVLSINALLQSLFAIWGKLSSLEFIGQHKENIVVTEQVTTQVIKDKKGWSVLD